MTVTEKSSSNKNILRSFSVLLSSQLVTWAFTSVYIIISPRYLGPENVGRITLAFSISYIIEMGIELGMLRLVIREIARDPTQTQRLISGLILWRLVMGVIAYVGLVLTVTLADYPAAYRPIFYVVGLIIIFDLLSSSFSLLFQALEQFRYSVLMDISLKAVTLVVAIIVIVSGGEVWWMASATLCGTIVAVVEGFIWSRRFTKINLRVSFDTIKWLVWQGLPFWGTSVLLVIYTYIDSILLSLLAGEKAVGFYAPPVRLFNTSMFLPTALSTAVFPVLSRLYISNKQAMLDLSNQSLRWLVIASLPISVMVMAISPNIIPLLYGNNFEQSVPVMAILGATLFSTYISILANQFLVVNNRQLEWTKVMLVASILNPLINLVLITYFKEQGNGAIGAAWSLFITETLMLIPAYLLLPKGVFNLDLLKQTLRTGVACLPMAAVVLWLDNWFVIIPAGAGLLVFLACAWALKALPLDELMQAKTLLLKKEV